MYTIEYDGRVVARFNKLGDAFGFVKPSGFTPVWRELLDESGEHRIGWKHGRWIVRG